MLAWSVDERGSELHTIQVRDCASGIDRPDRVPDTDGEAVWFADGTSFLYVRLDENHRASRVFRHWLGRSAETDELVFSEPDPGWFVSLHRLRSGDYAVVSVHGHDASESHLIDLRAGDGRPRLLAAREPGLRYAVDQRGTTLFIRTNADGAEDFKIVTAPIDATGRGAWTDLIPHRSGTLILHSDVMRKHLVRLEREGGLPRIVVRSLADGAEHTVSFAEEAYALSLQAGLEQDTTSIRFAYSSMTTPEEIVDYEMVSRERTLRKRRRIPSGHDPAAYVTRRIFAPSPDGARVPVSLIYAKDTVLDGSAPLLLYGYGAYGHAIPAAFGANRLSLVDRGFVYAIAHVRGGTDKGWAWYTDGKLAHKPNTFADFIAAARHLVAERYTSAGRIVAHGGSAGGMLMGAVANLAPDLFAGIIADVPFVDVLTTMLDAELPLDAARVAGVGQSHHGPRGFRHHRWLFPRRQCGGQALPGHPGARRTDGSARHLLGTGQVGRAAAGDHDGRRPRHAAHQHGCRPRRRFGPLRSPHGCGVAICVRAGVCRGMNARR